MTPRPGDFGLVRMSGLTRWAIRLGQWLNGDGFADYQHAFLVLDDESLIEAEPGGARIRPLSEYSDAVYSDWPLTEEQRAAIVAAGRELEGIPYSVLDYLSLALVRLHIRPRWVTRYVASTGHLICSQLVDHAYLMAGVHLFTDGRFEGDVTPADLVSVLHGPIREA